jgi:hypothetical protein
MGQDIKTVITSAEQITPEWLTHVLYHSNALTEGHVIASNMTITKRELSTSVKLNVTYSKDARGDRPIKLFLKMVTTDMEDEFFGVSEVNYYTRDYINLKSAPLPRTYHAAYSEAQRCYHILMEDVSETHVTAGTKPPTLEYGLALVEAFAVMHSYWWGQNRLRMLNETIPDEYAIQRFVEMGRSGAEHILHACGDELKLHWAKAINTLYTDHPRLMVRRTQAESGFTLIHGDANHHNILVPKTGERPLYIVDRQPFDWSLTTWLGVYDIAYAVVLYWDVELRRQCEKPLLTHYWHCLSKHGVQNYSWEQLWDDYRLCVPMGVYVATEWCRGGVNWETHPYWMPKLQRSMTAFDDLRCVELLA